MNDSEPRLADSAGASFDDLASALLSLEAEMRALEAEMADAIAAVPPGQRESATNLVHYVALRQRDLRALQERLAQHGLSSLGRVESCVLGGVLQASIRAHESLALRDGTCSPLDRLRGAGDAALTWSAARALLHQHTVDVFGPKPDDRHIYIMVTAPSVDEADSNWMVKLLCAGMNVLRINCAHETESEWGRMIEALARATEQTGKTCRVVMDLAGPKIRTGAIASSRRSAEWKPKRDELGASAAPARVVIRRAGARTCPEPAALFVADADFERLRFADELRFRDARGKRRTLIIETLESDTLCASSEEHVRLVDSVLAQVRRGKKHRDDIVVQVEEDADPTIDVRTGDTLELTGRDVVGSAPKRDDSGQIELPGLVSCTLPEALEHLQIGQRVLFDDGKIQTVVEVLKENGDFVLRVLRTSKPTTKLRAGKGINLPDTRVTVPGLTADDKQALAFVAKHAHAVSLSFVRSVADVRALHAELSKLGREDIAVILKIETRLGFENLPGLLLEGLRKPPLSVMIARGDLAVEVGFERLAELQEEILWLCEAAHVPAIWATQVLDTLARTGIPSRAEVTDASASVAAECVMLNKGEFIHEAVAVLRGILRRMEQHRYKKRSLFRKLAVSQFGEH
jgi:pyruvate kinase